VPQPPLPGLGYLIPADGTTFKFVMMTNCGFHTREASLVKLAGNVKVEY
jgi:hypothetical protein